MAAKINKEIKLINSWFKINKLSLNIIKSKFMVFLMPQREITPPKLQIDGILIDYVTVFNFVGINIQNNLKWDTHINSISLKIGQTVGILNRSKHSLPLNILHLLYCTLIVPHLHYGILLWGNANVRIYKLQKKALRIITGSKYNAHTEPLFKTANTLRMEDIFKLQQLKFIYSLQHHILPTYFTSFTTM